MILYHGSNVVVSEPKLIPQNRFLDFVSDNRAGNYEGPEYDFVYGPLQMMMFIRPLPSIRPVF